MTDVDIEKNVKDGLNSMVNEEFSKRGLSYRDIDLASFLMLTWRLEEEFSNEFLRQGSSENKIRLSQKRLFRGSPKGGIIEAKIYFSDEKRFNSKLISFEKNKWIRFGWSLNLREFSVAYEAMSKWMEWLLQAKREAQCETSD
jgi:hypothetical protein